MKATEAFRSVSTCCAVYIEMETITFKQLYILIDTCAHNFGRKKDKIITKLGECHLINYLNKSRHAYNA